MKRNPGGLRVLICPGTETGRETPGRAPASLELKPLIAWVTGSETDPEIWEEITAPWNQSAKNSLTTKSYLCLGKKGCIFCGCLKKQSTLSCGLKKSHQVVSVGLSLPGWRPTGHSIKCQLTNIDHLLRSPQGVFIQTTSSHHKTLQGQGHYLPPFQNAEAVVSKPDVNFPPSHKARHTTREDFNLHCK